MDKIIRLAREAFEPKVGRPLTDSEAADFALHFKRFAEFLLDCARDRTLMERLQPGSARMGSAETRVADNTSQSAGKPLGAPLFSERVALTDAYSHDPSSRDQFASPDEESPTFSTSPVAIGAKVDGSS